MDLLGAVGRRCSAGYAAVLVLMLPSMDEAAGQGWNVFFSDGR